MDNESIFNFKIFKDALDKRKEEFEKKKYENEQRKLKYTKEQDKKVLEKLAEKYPEWFVKKDN